MSLTTSTTLAGLCAALGLAWYTGGTVGNGIIAGFVSGAASAIACVSVQRRIARRKPQFLIHAVMGGFLFKASALLSLALAVHYVDALAQVFDAVSFAIAFAATAIVILLPATLDMIRLFTIDRSAREFAGASVGTLGSTSMKESEVQ